MSIHLLRHGATTVQGVYRGRSEVPLSPAGLAAMWQAVDGGRWTCVVSSPLQRCAAFAGAYAQAHALPLRLDEGWMELDFGRWEGRSVADIHAREPEALGAFWRDPWRHCPPEGETLGALQQRVFRALDALQRCEGENGRTLVVAHGGPIRVLLARRDGIPAHRLLQIEVPHAALLSLSA